MNTDTMAVFICERRKEMGLTQKQLAEKINVTDKAVSKWERGVGCPDITTLPQLAQALDVSVSELLEGKCAEAPAPSVDKLVQTTLRYSEKTVYARSLRVRRIVFFLLTAAFLIAAFVCVLCDFLICGGLTWSLYPLGSMAFAWLVLAPLFCMNRHAVAGSLASCSVFLIPLLYLIEQASSGQWLWAVAAPIVGVSLSYVWIAFWLFTRKGGNRWYASAILCLLVGPLTLFTNMVAALFEGSPPVRVSDIAVIILAAALATVLFAVGFSSKRRAPR